MHIKILIHNRLGLDFLVHMNKFKVEIDIDILQKSIFFVFFYKLLKF